MSKHTSRRWLAPVKINLFLHINGKIPEGSFRGYHEIQTYFQRLDYGDELMFDPLPEPRIEVEWQAGDESIELKPENPQDDLIYRAAELLQNISATQGHTSQGIRITLTKNAPVGGGLGGGSSAAATTLLALNKLWNISLPTADLIPLARKLGADVPIFLYETNAWAEGIGDQITPYPSPVAEQWFVIVVPNTHVITAKGFAHPDLIRNEVKVVPDELVSHWQRSGYNAFESITLAEDATIAACHQALRQVTGFSRLTGSGACLFSPVATLAEAEHAATVLAGDTEHIQRVIIAKALPDSPVNTHDR